MRLEGTKFQSKKMEDENYPPNEDNSEDEEFETDFLDD